MLARGVVALIAGALLSPGSAPADPHVLFRFADPRIAEASGIAHGIASPGVFYVQNDGGNPNQIFAVNGRDGRTAATITVGGARNVDWEDLAVAPAADGTPSIWIADIGDNDAVRDTVQLYRLTEPQLDPAADNRSLRLHVAEVWQLRYPNGPVNAESLAVAPDGTAYVATKSLGGPTVFQVPAHPRSGRVQLLRQLFVEDIHVRAVGNLRKLARQLLCTGAAISADGGLFALRTYAAAFVWRLGPRGLTGQHEAPVVVPLPTQPQGEGIAIVGNRLVIDSEQAGSAVYAVPLPRALTQPPDGGPPTKYHASASAPPTADTGEDDGSLGSWLAGIAAGVVAAAGIGLVVRARRRR